jgi:hypothetical protein
MYGAPTEYRDPLTLDYPVVNQLDFYKIFR